MTRTARVFIHTPKNKHRVMVLPMLSFIFNSIEGFRNLYQIFSLLFHFMNNNFLTQNYYLSKIKITVIYCSNYFERNTLFLLL